MSLYVENLLAGALPQTSLKWDPHHEDALKAIPSITGQKVPASDDLMTSDPRDAGLTDTDWLEQQFDLSLFDSLADVQHYDSAEDEQLDPELAIAESTIDEQLSFINSLPVDGILPLLAGSPAGGDFEKVARELMQTIAEQDFLSDTCSSYDSADSSLLPPLSPCSSGWNDSFSPLSPDETVFSYAPSSPEELLLSPGTPEELLLNPGTSEELFQNHGTPEELLNPGISEPEELLLNPSAPEESHDFTAINSVVITDVPLIRVDPEPVVIQVLTDPPSPSFSSYSDDSNDPDFIPAIPTPSNKRRITPYCRPGDVKVVVPKLKSATTKTGKASPVDKKQRKKLQNKNAATRYRVKKKSEAELIDVEYQELTGRNEELTEQVDQLTREIQYLKDLIHEVQKAKGII
ncbi:uncharacterized protein LOC141903867 [Tubulanus polymorphus]|uniref:uncharacterized protein LOC141903867 n=1 Tax=Tubulanus polymorphus TaxID=672921 RepID=UPI003DA46E95